MRFILTIAALMLNSWLLHGQEISEKNDPKKHPTLTNKAFVDKIEGRSIDFYLGHKDIDTPAKLFYKGKYALYDDEETFAFLDSVLTNNSETRPFYLFIYNQAMKVTDGALSEYLAGICTRYVRKYPCEFLEESNDTVSKIDKDKWIGFVAFDIYDKKTFESVIVDVEERIKINCSSKRPEWERLKIWIEEQLVEK